MQTNAASVREWDGTWSGVVLRTGDTVTVTIEGDKVLSYSVRGTSPFPILYSTVTSRSVSFGDQMNFAVSLHKTSARTAYGTARTPMGAASASLMRQ